jgi:Tfp pilus assembly protein PilF
MDNEEYKINFEKAEGYLKKGNFNQAIREFETALEKWPDDPRCYNKLGVCCAGLKNFVKAKSYLNLGLAYKRTKRINEAVKHFKRATEIDRKAPLSEIKKIRMKTKTKSNIIFFILILVGLIILWFLLKK